MKTPRGYDRLIVTYLCDQTEYSFVYLMKNINEQCSSFKVFKEEYEKIVNWKIKVLRSDNGLEYCSNEFKDLQSAGIQNKNSVPHTPESNGKIERLNRTLIGKTRTLLKSANMGLSF